MVTTAMRVLVVLGARARERARTGFQFVAPDGALTPDAQADPAREPGLGPVPPTVVPGMRTCEVSPRGLLPPCYLAAARRVETRHGARSQPASRPQGRRQRRHPQPTVGGPPAAPRCPTVVRCP